MLSLSWPHLIGDVEPGPLERIEEKGAPDPDDPHTPANAAEGRDSAERRLRIVEASQIDEPAFHVLMEA